jgi:hypothetical protein
MSSCRVSLRKSSYFASRFMRYSPTGLIEFIEDFQSSPLPVEPFHLPEAVFHASLTELESTGIHAVSAQSLAKGKSAELAREEIASAAAADAMNDLHGRAVISPAVERNLRSATYLAGAQQSGSAPSPASRWWVRAIPRPTVREWPSAWHATGPRRGQAQSGVWYGR